MKIYRPTETKRTTLTQEARVILEATPQADVGTYRRVQVLIPEGPIVLCGVDIPVQRKFDQPGIGPDRTYILPEFPTGQAITFMLLPGQFITAASQQGLSFVSLIIEYCDDR